ncbi:MAG: DNA polymerase I [Candidatus Marinimicrobia bacterium]|nr:DNA polymerase I [Candidatus Neomarinimicrobiota bacterium]
MTQNKERLFIIDGMAQIYRAHFAMINNPLTTKDGRHTSVIYGFLNMLFKIIRDESPDYLVIAMDSKAKTFRHEMYDEYKANRPKMPDEIAYQIPLLKEIVGYLGVELIERPGYEADDIMGSLSKIAESNDVQSYIVSGDKDMLQMVNDNIIVYAPGNRFKPTTKFKQEEVKNKMGVYPDRVIDLLSLIGDSSDNIPGVRGVGPKTAVKLIEQFDSLDKLIDNIDEIKNDRIKKLIKENIDSLSLSKKLVTIKADMDITFSREDFKFKNIKDKDNVIKMVNDFELSSIITSLEKLEFIKVKNKPKVVNEKVYKLILNDEELDKAIDSVLKADLVSFDLETTGVNPMIAEIVGISISTEPDKGFYIPILFPNTLDTEVVPQVTYSNIYDRIKPIFNCSDTLYVGQNIKYDMLILRRYGIEVEGKLFDTMIAAHLLNPDRRSYKMDFLSIDYLDYEMIPIENLIGPKGKNQKLMSDVQLKDISYYACEDTDVALQLHDLFSKELIKHKLDKIFYDIEIPTMKVLIDMEYEGINIDLSFFQKLSDKIGKNIESVSENIFSYTDIKFNINSPKQLSEILFDQLGLKPIKKRSTSVDVLEELKKQHPIAEELLSYRHFSKLKNTYLDAIPTHINSRTSRVHTSFNQTIASTGRLSSTKPNLQNIPIRTEISREIRKGFISRDLDSYIFAADYSQVELRVMAHFSKEAELIYCFKNDIDVHTRTASNIFKVDSDAVNFNQRRTAKVVNFSIMYGAGPFRLSQELDIPMKEAKKIIETYFDTYPGIKTFMDNTLSKAREMGYVETLLGRRRYADGLTSSNMNIVKAEERACINMPIQGTAAELIKIAMINVNNRIKKFKLKSKMILQIHDELLFEVPKNELELLSELVKKEMENAIKLDIPLKVDCDYGKNWFEAH